MVETLENLEEIMEKSIKFFLNVEKIVVTLIKTDKEFK